MTAYPVWGQYMYGGHYALGGHSMHPTTGINHHHHPYHHQTQEGYPTSYTSSAHPYYQPSAASAMTPSQQLYRSENPAPVAMQPPSYQLCDLRPDQLAMSRDLKFPGDYLRKRKPGGGRSKTRSTKSHSPPDPDNHIERVFIWDVDEVLLIYRTLFTAYTGTGARIGYDMERFVFSVADRHLFLTDLEDCDQLHVEDLIADDNGQDLTNYSFANDGFRAREGMNASRGGVDWQRKLSFRYRQIRENYKQHSLGNLKLVTDDQEAAYQRIIAEVQRLTNQWTEWVGRCLDIINNRRNSTSIIITTNTLVMGISKIMCNGLSDRIPIESIYSASKVGKKSCLERIRQRFGKNVTYVTIGESRRSNETSNIPHFQVNRLDDIKGLLLSLRNNYL